MAACTHVVRTIAFMPRNRIRTSMRVHTARQKHCSLLSGRWTTVRQKRFVIALRSEIYSHVVRARLGSSFTHLIHEASLAGGAGGVIYEPSFGVVAITFPSR